VSTPTRIILIDPLTATREVLARRLRAQGFDVDEAGDPATGADMALCDPPAAVVADLWMPGVSGVQICRLLRSEPATAEVPILLCGETDEPRNRFWADRAGANAYVPKRRTGDLVRAISRAIADARTSDSGFFMQLSGESGDIRDRIARQLDAALFDSVLASEVRALATCGAFERLFDLLAQFLSQVIRYRWVAVTTLSPGRTAVHCHPAAAAAVDAEVRAAVRLPNHQAALRIEDEDAFDVPATAPAIVRDIPFGNERVGQIALSPCSAAEADAAASVLTLVARELGGSIRMATLVEESQRLAATDPLTGIMNRRSFSTATTRELDRSRRYGYPLAVAVLDVDHFKLINDRRGHGAGDEVLAALGGLLSSDVVRKTDFVARWGGEEFVVAYMSTEAEGAVVAAERLRAAVEAMTVTDERGERIAVTVSIGVAAARRDDTLASLVGRADRAMYASKAAGRNRVTLSGDAGEGIANDAAPAPAQTNGDIDATG
jgi:two-component system cell cycle response regulator